MRLLNVQFIKIGLAAFLYPLALLRFVVILVDHILQGIHALGGHLAGDAAVAVPSDRAGSGVMGRSRRRALTGRRVVRELAGSTVVPVRALRSDAGQGSEVHPDAERVRVRSTALGRE